MMPSSVQLRISRLMLFVGPLTTILVTPFWNFDPINPIKVLVISVFSMTALGLCLPYLRELRVRRGLAVDIITLAFLISLISSFLFSGAPWGHQLWGQFGRSTGFVTYVLLLATFYVVASIMLKSIYARLISGLIYTATALALYGIVQFADLDPFSWSAKGIFGTLGNVNFYSGFMGTALAAAFVIFASSKSLNAGMGTKLFLIGLIALGIFIISETDSVQGLIAFAVGVAIFILIKSYFAGPKYFLPTFIITLFGGSSLALSLFNKGPLSSIVYQVTVVYRGDYMHAAIEMITKHPFFGVGIDSYDDWYRAERGVISAFRTGFNRTSNSAHNVALDIGSGGGLPLLLSYVGLLLLAIYSIFVFLKRERGQDAIFLSMVSAWSAYVVQSSVSINQIGVGVWGWILTGAIVGYANSSEEVSKGSFNLKPFWSNLRREELNANVNTSKNNKKSEKINRSPNTPPALPVILSAFFLLIGFTASFVPFKTDMDFRTAYSSGRLEDMIAVVNRPGTNALLISQAQTAAFSGNFSDQARDLNNLIVSRYPRYIFGWITRLQLPGFSENSKNLAVQKIVELDPYYAICLGNSPIDRIIDLLSDLPSNQQFELAKGWGLASEPNQTFSLRTLDQEPLRAKSLAFCTG